MTRLQIAVSACTPLFLILISTPARAGDLADYQRQQEQMRLNIEKLNRSNPHYVAPPAPLNVQPEAPLNGQPGTLNGEPAVLSEDPAALPGDIKPDPAFEKLGQMMKSPALQSYLKVMSDPVLIGQLEKVTKSPNRQILFFVEAGFFLMLMMFKSWCAAKITNWFIRFIIGLITNIGYFAIGSIIVPCLVIGEPYQELIKTILRGASNLIK
jgi:hypothetical protein